jgi:hypothetical protein
MDTDHAFAGQSLRTRDDRLVIYMILVSVSIACNSCSAWKIQLWFSLPIYPVTCFVAA